MNTALTSEQVEQFQNTGFLILRGMVPAAACARMLEVTGQEARDAIAPIEYETEVGYEGAPESFDAPGGRTIRRLRQAYHRDPCFRAWSQDPDLLAKLTVLLGEPVCMTLAHHNCIMTKHPDFGTATDWHRDIRYWSFTRPELISVWLALGPEFPANGGLKFIPGSHRLKIAPEQLDDLDFLRPELAQNQALFAQGVAPELQQGDIVFFHSGLFHAAGRNTTGTTKTSVVFAYRGQSNAPVAGTRSAASGDICQGD